MRRTLLPASLSRTRWFRSSLTGAILGARALGAAPPRCEIAPGGRRNGRKRASIQFSAMASRTRRRRRRSHTSNWKKILVPLGVLFAALAVAGGAAATWALDVYNSAPPLSSLQAGAEGPLLGDLRRRRQPDRLHPRQQHPPAGARGQLPQTLKDATVAIEDRNFFEHGAIDPEGIARAAWKDIAAGGKPVQGASTITQQLVRNLYIQQPRTDDQAQADRSPPRLRDWRKTHSKEWILTAYLNTAPYGTVEGQTAVGAEAAAQTYFSKPAKELDLTEAALIAGLPQAPSEYNPFLDPRAALERRNEVLEAMEEQGYITAAEYREASDEGLGLDPGHKYQVIRDPFLFDLVQQELIDKYGINTVRNGGLKAYTTIDPELQRRPQEAVDSCCVCYPEGGPAAGLASVDPETGEIVALASTEGYASESAVQLRLAGAPPARLLVQDLRPDDGDQAGHRPRHAPTTTAPRRRPWTCPAAAPGPSTTPSRRRRHDVARPARPGHSVNVVFAQLDLDVGPEERDPDRRRNGDRSAAGIGAGGGDRRSRDRRHAAGNGDAYATLANGGIHHDPTAISRVEFPNGKVDEPEHRRRRAGPHRGRGLRSDADPRGRDHRRAPAPATPRSAAAPRPARPAPRRNSPTPGSSATRRCTRPRSGSATRSRANATGFGGPTAGPIWRSFMESAAGRRMPRIRSPRRACPSSPASTANTPPPRAYSEYEATKRRRRLEGEEEAENDKRRAETKPATKRPRARSAAEAAAAPATGSPPRRAAAARARRIRCAARKPDSDGHRPNPADQHLNPRRALPRDGHDAVAEREAESPWRTRMSRHPDVTDLPAVGAGYSPISSMR